MPAKRSYTLRRKLLLWLLVPLLTLYAIRATYNYFMSIDLANDVYDRILFSSAGILADRIDHGPGGVVVDLPPAAHDVLLSDEYDTMYFCVRDARGRVVAGEAGLPPLPADTEIATGRPYYYDGRFQQRPVRVVFLRQRRGIDAEAGEFTIQVAETLAKRQMLIQRVLVSVLLPQAVIILLATVIVWVGVGKGLKPLTRLQRAVQDRSHLDLSPLSLGNVPDEARPLVNSINDLLARLGQVLAAQNRFIADAAHQLRTPIAGIKTQIEYALRRGTAEDSDHCLRQVYTSVDRLTRLVNQLLTLARNEPDADKMHQRHWVDLNRLASDVTMEWVPEALKKEIDLGYEGVDGSAMIMGDQPRLRELINNLLDNALRYTHARGNVTVRVSGGERPELLVEDDGPGIAPDERERVFERFYRVLAPGPEGSGLGLSIVREIARAHNAEVELADRAHGQGTLVRVAFPRTKAGASQRSAAT